VSADNLTVLTTAPGKFATKIFTRHRDGNVRNRDYDRLKFFAVESMEVAGIESLAAALDKIASNPRAAVIRGSPLPQINRKHTRRLLKPDRNTGDQPTFREEPRHWFVFDLDHIERPALTDPATDPEAAVEHAIGRLPPEFHDCSCYWHFSSSQSVFPDDDTLSLHLAYWSSVPLDNVALKRWAIATNQVVGGKLIDPALFNPVQIHYVARPVFNGMNDPLPRRSGLRKGLEDSVVLLIPPPDRKRPAAPSAGGYEPGAGFESFLAEIGGPRGFRDPIKSAIGSYVATYGSTADAAPLKERIRATIDRADPGPRSADQIERYRSDQYLDDLIDWTRQQHGDQAPKGFIGEPPPHVVDPEIPLDPLEDIRPAQFSDDHLALHFSQTHADKLRYVARWGTWLLWSATRWQYEDTLKAFDLARALCRLASAQVNNPSAVKLAAVIASAKTVAAVERLARADRRHATTSDQFDADAWIFNRNTRKGDR
jgi:hypothetical protein